jgi:hypothetical protein
MAKIDAQAKPREAATVARNRRQCEHLELP